MMRSALLVILTLAFAALACGKYGAPVRSQAVPSASTPAAVPAPPPDPDPAAPLAEPDEEEPTP